DLVIWCEVIEHLTENPVHALGEIHRALRPGGQLVVSTPNVTRCGNITGLLRGRNIYDPYHLGTPLGGSRHSREYTLRELRDLVAGCGFSVERAEARDLTPSGVAQRLFRTFMYRMFAPLAGAAKCRSGMIPRGNRRCSSVPQRSRRATNGATPTSAFPRTTSRVAVCTYVSTYQVAWTCGRSQRTSRSDDPLDGALSRPRTA